VLQERRHPQAIFPLTLFSNRVFVQCNLLVVLQGAGMFGAIQYLPTFIQTALGASATASGLVSTPQSVGLLVTSIIGGQFVSRTGRFKYQVIFGACVTVVAAFLLQRLDVGEAEWHISLFMVLFGLGSGLIGPTISVVVQSSVTHEFMGVATSGRQFFMQMGQVLGVAIFGLVFTTTYASSFSHDLSAQARSEITPADYASFQDPTLALDPRELNRIRANLLQLPDGQAILDDALRSQKEGVTTAIDRLFLGSTLAGAAVVLLALTLREIPLRRSFSTPEAAEELTLALEPVP
jgi:MFS family permease